MVALLLLFLNFLVPSESHLSAKMTGGMGVLCVCWAPNPPRPVRTEQVAC